MTELVKENHNLKIKGKDAVARVAINLRADIKEQDVPQSWPPDVKSEEECPTIPESLSIFLCYLLTGCHDVLHATQRVQRLVQSFGQDIVYAVTCGSIKPSKHIILPFSVKSLTGNVELINILNRLGHCVSYSQMEEIDTALCLQKLISAERDIALPTNICPGLFTTLAWDNIDCLEETVSGKGTSHRVNGIAVQPKKSDQDAVQPKPDVAKSSGASVHLCQCCLLTMLDNEWVCHKANVLTSILQPILSLLEKRTLFGFLHACHNKKNNRSAAGQASIS